MWVLGAWCLYCALFRAPPARPDPPLLAPQPRHHHLPIRRSTAGDWMHTKPTANPHSCCTNLLQAPRSACVSLETHEIGFWHHLHSSYATASKRMHIVAPQPWTRPSYTALGLTHRRTSVDRERKDQGLPYWAKPEETPSSLE